MLKKLGLIIVNAQKSIELETILQIQEEGLGGAVKVYLNGASVT